MSGDSQLPEATRTAIERYHLEGCRVRNWLQSAQNMDWSQNDRIPSISELIQASQLVRDTGLDVPRDVILSARTSYLERKEVDGWYKDQARGGFGTAGAQLEEHQYFTGQWKILLDNLSAGLKSVPIPTLADDAIRDASPTINPFTVVSGFESLALADSHPLTTPRGVALPTSDEPPRKDFTTLENESKLRRTTRDYIFSAGMLYQSWQAFVNSPENRLFNAWISTLGVERAVLGAWSELDSGKRLTSGFDHIVRLFTEDSQRPYNGFLVDSKESFEVDRADGASQEASVQVNVDKIGARLQQIIARTAIWKEIVAAIRPKSSDNSDDNFLDYLDRIQRQISIQKVKYAPADEMGKTVALLSEVIKWSSPKAKPPLEARGARLPPYYLPKLFVMRAFQRAIGLISQSVIVISETALVADLYLLSMKSYGTTSFDKQATGDASDTKEVVLASKYAREIYAAVTLTLEVSDRQVYKGIANFWDNLKSFHSDLLILSSTGNVRIPKPLTNSPPAVAHIFVMLNARCIEFADTLWNAYQVIPSFLHLYNALQRMGLIKRIAIVEMVLKYALMVGAKGLFGGQPPKNNFRIHYDNMPFVHELLRHPGAKKGDKSTYSLQPKTTEPPKTNIPIMEVTKLAKYHFHSTQIWNSSFFDEGLKTKLKGSKSPVQDYIRIARSALNGEFEGAYPFTKLNYFKVHRMGVDSLEQINRIEAEELPERIDPAEKQDMDHLRRYPNTMYRLMSILDVHNRREHRDLTSITKDNKQEGRYIGRVCGVFEKIKDGDDLSAWYFRAE